MKIERHDPRLRRRVPDHFRVAITRDDMVEHWVSIVVLEGHTAVVAVRDALRALRANRRFSSVCKYRNNRLLATLLKARSVLPIDDRRAGPAAASGFVRRYRSAHLLPMHKIGAYRMAPILVSARTARRHVLEEEVISPFVID